MPRNPKSNELKAIEGVRPDRINADEPMPPTGIGDPPDHLDDYGRRAWANLLESWDTIPVIKRPDREACVRYCEAYSTNRHASDRVKVDGLMIEETTEIQTEKTTIRRTSRKAHPLLPTIRQTERVMLSFLSKFGMTPASRAGLKVPTDPKNNTILKLMDERRGNRGGNRK